MSYHIRTGVWTDYSHGSIIGNTLTLSPRDGALLLAFIAAFVTAVSSQLWRIISFSAHQIRAHSGPHDGLHFQTQAILRNASAPFSAAWLFLQQSWSWRGRVKRSYARTLVWAVFSLLYLPAFAVLAVFSSQVSKAATQVRLLQGLQCGYWTMLENVSVNVLSSAPLTTYALDAATAYQYARTCYSANTTSPECNLLPQASLSWKGYNETECPFGRESAACEEGQAIHMSTGPIDSHFDLGINAPPGHRLTISKNATCAPIPVEPHATYESLSANDSTAGAEYGLWEYNFGPVRETGTDYTFRYNTAAQLFGFGYTVVSYENQAGQEQINSWVPIQMLSSKQADVSIFFILMNSVRFLEPCDDPVFAAHSDFDGDTYTADRPVSVISCIEQNQICNSVNGRCSPLHGRRQMMVHDDESASNLILDLNLNVQQIATLERIQIPLMQSGLFDSTSLRGQNALRASETVLSGFIQLALPENQWLLEVTGWFEESLAKLQYLIQEYATGPSIGVEGSELLQLWVPENGQNVSKDKALRVLAQTQQDHCSNQITRDTQGTISFSVLGLILIFTIGGLIILASLTLIPFVTWLQERFKSGEYKRRTWMLDDMLQVQKMLLAELGLGVWSGSTTLVPVTIAQDKFEFTTSDTVHSAVQVTKTSATDSKRE